MLMCQVLGTVVATAKSESFRGARLLLVQERQLDGSLHGPVFVATDSVGAGSGELVLVATGSAARAAGYGETAPTDAAIVAIVDSVQADQQEQARTEPK